MDTDLLKYLHSDSVILNFKAKNKRSIISSLLDRLIEVKKVNKNDKKEILKVVLQREEMGSTAIGGYIALPHARLSQIKDVVVCLAIAKKGIDFESLDDEPVNVIVLLLSNQKEAGLHLKALAHLAKLLRDKLFIQQLKNVNSEDEAMSLILKQQTVLK